MRYYLTDLSGDGSEDNPFHSVIQDLISIRVRRYSDLRFARDQLAGKAVWTCEPTTEQHNILTADSRIKYLFDDQDTGISTALKTAMEAKGLPVNESTTLADVKRIIKRRGQLRGWLKSDDFPDLDQSLSALPTAKLQAAKTKLIALGFDTSNITLGNTVREAVKELLNQANNWPQE